MSQPHQPGVPPNAVVRLAVAGMSLAVLALGALAVWSAYVTEHESRRLSRVGVQTTGQLRAVQALYVIRVQTDLLEEGVTPEKLARLQAAREHLPEALERMRTGDAPEAVRVAGQAQPLARQLDPAIDRFLADPRGDIRYRGEDGDDTAEDAMEVLVEELELLLNDSESDPAELLDSKLRTVTDAGRTVQRTALVLIPLGLAFVVACAWFLRLYRRRFEEAMRAALRRTAQEARTDPLTGLPNRRSLLEELDRRMAHGDTFTVALADLNGFKHYNDTFGHPAGDALLRRLGHKLSVAWEGRGFAARFGGDEFCVVADNLGADQLRLVLSDALSEQGDGFSISAVCGLAVVPDEAPDPSAALTLADTRLYAAKAVVHSGRTARGPSAAAGATADASPFTLVDILAERFPALSTEVDLTTELAVTCARLLGLPDEQVATIERAAQLYDVGKIALPAAILAKRGALTEDERTFVQRHTEIGERLLNGFENLEQVAAIVRGAHEHWDGGGYPDQLAGEEISIGARIIAVVDAFCAMTTNRPYAPARSVPEALAELRRCSGTQFDPAVVTVLAEAVSRGAADRRTADSAAAARTRS